MSDLDHQPDVRLVRKHLITHLGPPEEVFEVQGSPIKDSPLQTLQLPYFAPGGHNSPVVFATCGACLYRMRDGRRVEAMMLLRREPPREHFAAIHKLLASFSLFAEANDDAVRIGDVIRGSADLRAFAPMNALMFTAPTPFPEVFHRFSISQGMVELVWLLPIHENEAAYALKFGGQALMVLFAAQGLDPTNLERPQADTTIQPEDAKALANRRSEEAVALRAAQLAAGAPGAASPYQISDHGDAVVVLSRGIKKPKARKPLASIPKIDPTAAQPRAPARGPVQQGPVIGKDGVVRFQLPESMKRKPPPVANLERKKKSGQLSPEEQAEAKRKKVEDLKARAREAARRAAAKPPDSEEK